MKHCVILKTSYLCTRLKKKVSPLYYIFKRWHKKEHINLVREREETSTVSESVWHLQMVVKFSHVVEQKDARNYLFLPKEDISDNESLSIIHKRYFFESNAFFMPKYQLNLYHPQKQEHAEKN